MLTLSSIEFLTTGAEVKRYHTVTTLREETVGHHSHGVALLCLYLNPQAGRELLYHALVHDLAEQFTGDIPSPAKRSMNLNDVLESIERNSLHVHMRWLPLLESEDERTLKIADLAQGALFCLREVELGNSRMRAVLGRYIEYFESLNPRSDREKDLLHFIKEKAK